MFVPSPKNTTQLVSVILPQMPELDDKTPAAH